MVVLSDEFWQSRFARSPAIVGKILEANGVPLTIVGIAPRDFHGLDAEARPAIFLPLSMEPILSPTEGGNRLADSETWWLSIYGRIKANVSDEQAQGAMAGIFSPEDR